MSHTHDVLAAWRLLRSSSRLTTLGEAMDEVEFRRRKATATRLASRSDFDAETCERVLVACEDDEEAAMTALIRAMATGEPP